MKIFDKCFFAVSPRMGRWTLIDELKKLPLGDQINLAKNAYAKLIDSQSRTEA